MEYQDIILEKENGVAILTINRPTKMNALADSTFGELADVTSLIERDDAIKVLIITGAGDRAFCAGADLGSLTSLLGDPSDKKVPGKTRWEMIQPLGVFVEDLANLHKPVIAAINGVAAGAGLSLALLCDIRIASADARFTLAFVNRGLIPDCGATYYMPRLVGTAKAIELMWTGDIIDAKEAERIGLVSKVVAKDSLMSEAKDFARRLAQGPSVAIDLIKYAVQSSLVNNLGQQLEFETRAQKLCDSTLDFKEGVQSFFEKRKPHFQGK